MENERRWKIVINKNGRREVVVKNRVMIGVFFYDSLYWVDVIKKIDILYFEVGCYDFESLKLIYNGWWVIWFFGIVYRYFFW